MDAGAHAPAAGTTRSFSPDFQRELEDLFAWRRDVRRFKPDPVTASLLDQVLASVGSAPSVGLSEPWRLVLVDDPKRRDAVRANFATANAEALADQSDERAALYAKLKLSGLDECPVQISVFCDESTEQGAGLGAATMPEMRRYSVVCAVMQMWLTARSLGVGMGWVSILDPVRLAKDLDVPEGWTLIAHLCLGWPEEEQLDCELERAGWEHRKRLSGRILQR